MNIYKNREHRLIKNNREDNRCRLFQIWMKLVLNNPKSPGDFRAIGVELQNREPVLRRLRETPQGYCERVHTNIGKTLSSVLSVIFY